MNERVQRANPDGVDNAARLASNTAVGTLGWDREMLCPLTVAHPPAKIHLEATLPSRNGRYAQADRDRWPYDPRFLDTSHQDPKSYASVHARSSANDSRGMIS